MAHSTLKGGRRRKVAIAVDLSDESAFAVRWAVANYIRAGDAVILLHVQPTRALYGADWGAVDQPPDLSDEDSQRRQDDDFDALTSNKVSDIAKPLVDAGIPYKIHIVKDHDMKERLCLEVERLRVDAVIMGSRGFGAAAKRPTARLGSVSDYCLHHCDCPVVVVRYAEEEKAVKDAPSSLHNFAPASSETVPGTEKAIQGASIVEPAEAVPRFST